MNAKLKLNLLILICLAVTWVSVPPALACSPEQAAEQPVVRVVMFWSRTCGHCEYVIKNVLPPLQTKYGDQLEFLMIELASQEDVDQLFMTATALGIDKDAVGVPFMIVGDRVLQGSQQIPAELPGLIEAHLAQGGIDYPSLPALAVYLPTPIESVQESLPDTAGEEPLDQAAGEISENEAAEGLSAPASNGMFLAMAVLVGISLAVIYAIYALVRGGKSGTRSRPAWIDLLTPLLAVIGLGVAAYLAYVETQAVAAVCGPIGDCNAVQSSTYARLFSVLPIGILGLIGYALILMAWFIQRMRNDQWGNYASITILGMGFIGTAFSIYLTYLEVYVIEAVCLWCLSSAVIMTLIMLLGIRPAQEALNRSDHGLKKRRLRMLNTQGG
jgi:uncharacterized membrane protein